MFWASDKPQEVYFGVYTCQRCAKTYTVNDEWAPCTPDFCHACTTYLRGLYALVPDPEPRH